ncbi:hypothetical protein CAEBREN_00624 [Caenorhabditis brenneri]|uniref:BTB domain-containing protein n=1 Tax=Caenorhabditis brenneri TaxID=135651 RepID=G0MYJ8_CAEBE|nr:hypothetical protein CAEBREN_00624 [Caenorhabditis brenneri]
MSSGNIVKLNIGGTIFQTTKSTLTKFGGYFKTRLESGIPLERDDDGAIFVDRSPKHFGLILNFMRDGEVGLPECPNQLKEVLKEAQFYCLEDLQKLCVMGKELIPRNNNHFLDTIKEVINASLNCTKKAVIMIPYHPDNYAEENRALIMSTELQKYVTDFDVYFVSSKAVTLANCRIRDTTSGKVNFVAWEEVEQFMKNNYGV